MSPIRVGLIGLSQSAKTSWASTGHLPYLLSPRGRERYNIVALLNSSVSAAQAAIRSYNLPNPDSIRAYGKPEDLAADRNVDLVVCSVRVDIHYDTIKPSLEAGKNVFVEWPVAENVHRASELAEIAERTGAKTLVGLQGRVVPPVVTVRDLVHSGRIGRVTSSFVRVHTARTEWNVISEGLAYFFDKKIGGNSVTIALGHTIDLVHSVLGEYQSSSSQAQIQRPSQKIRHADGTTTPAKTDVPDLVSLHGVLEPSAHVVDGAVLEASLHTGPPFPGQPTFAWGIIGEKGRIRVTTSLAFISLSDEPIPIQIEDFESGRVENIAYQWDEWQEALPGRGRSTGKIYDLYAEGKEKEAGVMDIPSAIKRHAQLDGYLWPNA